MSILNIAIIGVGKMGGALALALHKKGYKISELVANNCETANKIADLIEPRPQIICAKDIETITADVIFITTQDWEISRVAKILAEKLEYIPYIFHTSGALSSKALNSLSDEGCEVASIHPLVSISDAILGANRFKDAYFCIEGDLEAVEIAKQIINDLEGKSFSIETKKKPLYHASAVMACGHLTTLISAAVEMLSKCGLSSDEAQEVLLPLIKSTVKNLETQTTVKALTGTFARADVETLYKHLNILEESDSEEILDIYIQLGLRSLEIARQQGASLEKLEQMRDLLKAKAKKK